MRYKGTFILLIIAIALAVYFFFFEQPRHRSDRERRVAATQLTTLTPDHIHSVTLEQPDVTMRFERTDSTDWRLVAPVHDLADQSNVNVVVRTITSATIERRLENAPARLDEYGLSEPVATVTLGTWRKDDAFIIAIGNHNPTKASCYVMDPDGDVSLIAAGIRRYAQRSLSAFRRKHITAYGMADVAGLEMTASDGWMKWRRVRWDTWQAYADGDTLRGDPMELEAVVRELRGLRASDILDPSTARPEELDDPAGEIRVLLKNAPTQSYLFSHAINDTCFVATNFTPRIIRIQADPLHLFENAFVDFRERRVLEFSTTDLDRIELHSSATSMTIRREANRWAFPNPAMGTIDQDAVAEIILILEDLKYIRILEERIANPAVHALDHPAFRLTLYDRDGNVLDELRAGEPQTARRVRYTTSLSSRHLGRVDTEPLDEVERRFQSFRVQ